MIEMQSAEGAVDAAAFLLGRGILEPSVEQTARASALLQAAQAAVEKRAGRVLAPREIEFTADVPPGGRCWHFPIAPLVSVVSVGYSAPFAGAASLTPDQYSVVDPTGAPRLVLASGLDLSGAVLRVVANMGYAAAATYPPQLVQAASMVAGEWFDAGFSVENQFRAPRLSFAVDALCDQVRFRRVADWG